MAKANEVSAIISEVKAPAIQNTLQSLLKSDAIKKRFSDVLGAKANAFISSILTVANNTQMLQNADPMTIISAAAVAASLDLPINPSLGFAHIVPYNNRKTGKVVAQFQMGWRGYVQLAQRTGLYETMNAGELYEGQLKSIDTISGKIEVDPDGKKSDKVVGYFAHFRLLNGFNKTLYITKENAEKHGKKYSKTFAIGQWTDNFDAMAIKTAVKALFGKWAPLSTDYQMQKALKLDQAVIAEDGTATYIDNPSATTEAEVIENIGKDGEEIGL